jgi:hypothetical protein
MLSNQSKESGVEEWINTLTTQARTGSRCILAAEKETSIPATVADTAEAKWMCKTIV